MGAAPLHDRNTAAGDAGDNWDVAAVAALLHSARDGLARQETRRSRPLSSIDPVTGLLTHRAFAAAAEATFSAAQRRAAPVSAVIVDLDRLRDINDALGRDVGDAVLGHVARYITMNIQPGVDLCARLSGAELALLLPEADYAWSSAFAERLRGALANRPLHFGDQMLNISASFGVASIVPGDATLDTLVARARCALRSAKDNGRNAVGIAAGQMAAA